ncbi:MAG TPA: anhydro-N-acetylmuramic acid kinase [Lentimicrobium sp.]|nr:anhydro-N-acetylmuramic acid kinase [Lentimicrobium sp.]
MKKTYKVIGLMSGTSLDGLDIAFCEFSKTKNEWGWEIIVADTIEYDTVWIKLLKEAPNLDGLKLSLLNTSYGHWIGQTVNEFISKNRIKPQLISSHGHTVFHSPSDRMTLQIGSGAAIAAETRITTVSDFRSLNIALGGQGAPLVPIGDRLLFGEFDACVNFGGFANISMESSNERLAYDICPVNIVLNFLAGKLGLPFDAEGMLASKGSLNIDLFHKLENIEFYNKPGPRSLGREWVEDTILPIINQTGIEVYDHLCTYNNHIASQILRNLPKSNSSKVIFTGGGTYNTFLMSLIREKSLCKIVIPSEIVINFKEALIFAFLGILRFEGIDNCLAEATGSACDCSGGAVHLPPLKYK